MSMNILPLSSYISGTAAAPLDKESRWFAIFLAFSFGNGIIAHLVPSLLPLTLYSTDALLFVINGWLLSILYRQHGDRKLLYWALATYLGTFFIEAAGVATGRIFGAYTYGPTMFVQWLGVPLVIALNWTVLILAVNQLATRWVWNPILASLLSGLFIALYDFIIEPVAIRLNYWTWADVDVPLQNYIAWAVIGFLFSLPLHLARIRYQNNLLLVYLLVQGLFFLALNLFM